MRPRDLGDEGPRAFSCLLMGFIFDQWRDYNRGIPPTREWCGRNAQNPILLDAFAALDRAEGRAHQSQHTAPTASQRESRKSFVDRIRSQSLT